MLGRESALRLLHFATELLDGAVVFAEIDALLLLVQLDEMVDYALTNEERAKCK